MQYIPSRQAQLARPTKPVLAGAPHERWYIDLIGPHPKSDRGHVYILTCIDSFTKWAEAFPLRNREAETIARVLVEQVFTHLDTSIRRSVSCNPSSVGINF